MPGSLEASRAKTRASKACTACRQVKLRCDADKNFPDFCTRCKSSGRACRVDPSFKRTSTRNQLEHVTNQLADLRRRVEMPPHGGITPSLPKDDITYSDRHLQKEITHGLRTASPTLMPLTLNSIALPEDMFGLKNIKIEDIDPAQLGDTTITPEQIHNLFSFFTEHQYQYLPILDSRVSLKTVQKKHPLLFWTVIVTASRYHHTYHAIAASIKQAYHDLLARFMIRAPISLSSIQSLLLLCYWPFPCLKQIFDPSWNFYGVALNAARFWTLYTPAENLSFKSDNDDHCLRAKVWLGCFHVGTLLALHWGVPLPISSISDLHQIRDFTKTVDLPPLFMDQIRTHYEIAQYRAILSGNKAYGLALSTTKLFEANLDRIRRSSTSGLDEVSEMCQLRVKISLYTTVLMLAQSVMDRSAALYDDIRMSTLSITISGLRTASRLVHIFAEYCEKIAAETSYIFDTTTQETDSFPLLCVPKQYFTAASMAAFFLVTFCMFNDRINSEDKVMAENTLKVIHRVFERLSRHRNDEFARILAVMKAICTAGSWKMMLIDRECASIWFDACRRAGDLRNRGAHEVFHTAIAAVDHADEDSESCTPEVLNPNPVPVSSYDNADIWLPFPDFSDMDWSLTDHDIFSSLTVL